ncbi:2-oxo-4-hydroxy-4-carboxy-5-ureidoimidazoline decarboxylase [bacterium]|nr:MAG: 2-oxo-4-hydroxy-4-carboxy-5-ureidoimidazoline decarboxylase [bacterium]
MDEMNGLARLNGLNEKNAWDELLRCCGASKWALKMMSARPFVNSEALYARSERVFASFQEIDWLEAFSHHPKIGDIDALRLKFATTREWAGNEQIGTSTADEATLEALATGNEAYEKKFGFIFIICATGKSAAEMLDALNDRLGNDRETELRNAGEHQQRITHLRIEKLLTL